MATKKTTKKETTPKEETKEEVKQPEATKTPVDPSTLSPFGKLMNGLGFFD